MDGNTETAKGIGSPHHEAHFQGQKADVSAFFSLFSFFFSVGFSSVWGGDEGFAPGGRAVETLFEVVQ